MGSAFRTTLQNRQRIAIGHGQPIQAFVVGLFVCLSLLALGNEASAPAAERIDASDAGPRRSIPSLTKKDVLSIQNGQFFLDGKRFVELSFNKFDLFWQLYNELTAGKPLDSSNPMVQAQDQTPPVPAAYLRGALRASLYDGICLVLSLQ